MIYSKANLSAIKITTGAPPELALLHLAPDGSTVASDGRVMIAVSPVDSSSPRPQLGGGGQEVAPAPGVGTNLRPEIVGQILRNMPREAALQVAVLTAADAERVEMLVVDRARIQRTEGLPMAVVFPRWRELFRRAWERVVGGRNRWVCLPRRRLIKALETMDAASGDRSDNAPVWVYMGELASDPVVLRTRNYSTRQGVVAVVSPLETGSGGQEGFSKWERLLLGIKLIAGKKHE